MTLGSIIPEDKVEEYIEFLDQDIFEAVKIVIVADVIKEETGGRGHVSARGSAKGNAYCYEEVKYKALD